ncbi:MAG: glycosyltransferase family 2 protein [Chloroflexi bacterium]|nr:glycosyltransferase family 2 protein [Chloroflexota bacterium]
MDISVVVPAFNEEKFIGPALDALLKQDFKGSYEIIVVDNASTDRTAQICRDKGVKVVHEPKKGVVYARQSGFLEAKGSIIATTDADTIVPPDWLSWLYEGFRSCPRLSAFGGLYRLSDGPLFHRIGTRLWLPFFCVLDNVLIGGGLLGCNMAIRRSAFLASKGFNLELKWNEDGEISRRLQKYGKVEIDRKSFVYTSGRRYNKGILHGLLPYVLYSLSHLHKKKDIWRSRHFRRTALTGLAALVLISAGLVLVRPPWPAQAHARRQPANLAIMKVIDEVRETLGLAAKPK